MINHLPPECELGTIAHRRGDIEGADDELLHLGAGQWLELDIGALQVGDEIGIPHHALERVAQRADALGGSPGGAITERPMALPLA